MSEQTREIKVPALGESVVEAIVARWLKNSGEAVEIDEALVELETDKVTLEVMAPVSGVLNNIQANEGDTVEVGALLGYIQEGATATPSQPTSQPSQSQEQPTLQEVPIGDSAPSTDADSVLPLAPAVRKLIEENQLNPQSIKGTGKDGRLTKGDVLTHMKAPQDQSVLPMPPNPHQPTMSPAPTISAPPTSAAPSMMMPAAFPESAPPETASPAVAAVAAPNIAPPPPVIMPAQQEPVTERETRVPMTKLRQKIAERLKHAQNTAAILTTFNEVDMSSVMDIRKRYKEVFEKTHEARLGFMSFFVTAAVRALKEMPIVNARIEGNDIVYNNAYDIGVAVSAPKGLIVPVLRQADQLNFAGIEKKILELGLKAKEGKLSIDELTGGTFTISNGGVFGSLISTPILNPPQSGILGMHKIQERAVVVDGQIVVRPMMYLALSYDHRIIDGSNAVSFLVRIKDMLENPERLLLEV